VAAAMAERRGATAHMTNFGHGAASIETVV
jgi:hypothetical protein